MYAKRIQISNYGPLEHVDISLPFVDENPQPLLLVGENGAGKTILLSHIVNGLMAAKNLTYPQTPEVAVDKVYKVRSPAYITSGKQHYFGRVDFEGDHYVSELQLRSRRDTYASTPEELDGSPALKLWDSTQSHESSKQDSSFYASAERTEEVKDLVRQRCVLYFPSDRFEEPAWLNAISLTEQAHRTHVVPYEGYTARRLIATSPLRNNQDWLYDIVYDRAAFELRTRSVQMPIDEGRSAIPLTLFRGYSGNATNLFLQALAILQVVVQDPDARFILGMRNQRNVSIYSQDVEKVPNIFQLSSGEASLLNLGLSILRDADMSDSVPTATSNIRGIVLVDEIDLHLHAFHQYEVLPKLLKMFPQVQFIVTTHSPLLVLGMRREFGEDRFSLYRVPDGLQISSEEFTEFGRAYSAFRQSNAYENEMRELIRGVTKPVIVVEGKTDKCYIEQAAEILGETEVLSEVEIMDGGGAPKLKTLWNHLTKLPNGMLDKRVLLLFDCDEDRPPADEGPVSRRTLPFQSENPIKAGIENLFSENILNRAIAVRPAFIDQTEEHKTRVRGEETTVLSSLSVNKDEKKNLCRWICENGTEDDFRDFSLVFDLISKFLARAVEETTDTA